MLQFFLKKNSLSTFFRASEQASSLNRRTAVKNKNFKALTFNHRII